MTGRGPYAHYSPLGVAYVIGTYPLLTTTFIDREMALLRAAGVELEVVSLRRPHGRLSPEQREIRDDVRYVLPVSPWVLARAHLRYLVTRPRTFFGTLGYLLSRSHPTWRARFKTLLHFGEGVQVADLLRTRGEHLVFHAHFVDRAATVALVASRLLGRPYSVTAHANDIYVDPVLLPEKLREARFVATCTEYNAAYLEKLVPGAADAIVPIHHGLDVTGYEPSTPDSASSSDAAVEPVILAVGQLKEKKGFDDLVAACGLLRDRGRGFVCEIVGEGPRRARLERLIRELDLEEYVSLLGALDHRDVIERYRSATVFALPCITASDGDRDGIPNVILEAMAMHLPVVSTDHSGIPEAVADGVNGVLVPQRDVTALADALESLLKDPDMRRRMGERGREIVLSRFDVAANVKLLMSHLGV